MPTHVLFLCSQNRLRSPTAEKVFSRFSEIECKSAGTDRTAGVVVTTELIQWADVIFVMEKLHRNKITKQFKHQLGGKRVVILGIPDDYEFMDPGLIKIIQQKVGPLLRLQSNRDSISGTQENVQLDLNVVLR
jgi:predicted protein tyrosine phosphatase